MVHTIKLGYFSMCILFNWKGSQSNATIHLKLYLITLHLISSIKILINYLKENNNLLVHYNYENSVSSEGDPFRLAKYPVNKQYYNSTKHLISNQNIT